MSYNIEVTDQNFDEIVKNSDIPVIVDFWAPWCGPCRMLAPLFEVLAEKYEWKIKFAKVNVDENPQTAIRYNIQWIPSIILMKEWQVFKTLVWVKQEEEYKKEFDTLLWENNYWEKKWEEKNEIKEGETLKINWWQEFISALENNKDKLVIADFWAPWCGPCKMLAPTLDQLAKEFNWKIQVIKVNVDEQANQEIAQQFQVSSIPTLAFIKNGNDPEISVWVLPYEQLKEYIEKNI